MRKKKYALLLLLYAIIVLFIACHKADDDCFDHKYKISKTWIADTKSSPITYHYEDGKLKTINFPDYPYFHFVYEKKFQVKRIDFESMDGQIHEWADISYEDNKIAEIKIYKDNELVANQKFKIVNKKIAEIYSYILPSCYELKAEIKNLLFDVRTLELLTSKDAAKNGLFLESEHYVSYTDNNITSVVTYDKLTGDTINTSYVYDNYINPYYGLNFNTMGLKGYCRNNPISETITLDTTTYKYTYNYVYDKHNYPTLIFQKENNAEEGINIYIEYTK